MMIYTLFSICRVITGAQSTQIKGEVTENVQIRDCFFREIRTHTGSSPIYMWYGSTFNVVNMTNTYFYHCKAVNGGSFSFEGDFQFIMSKSAVDSCESGSQMNACAGYIKLQKKPTKFDLTSFYHNQGGSRNLQVNGGGDMSNTNVSHHQAGIGWISYAYGNVLFEHTSSPTHITYTNFQNCQSQCGIMYYSKASGPNTLSHTNFQYNTVTGWGLLIPQNSGNLDLEDCIFYGNNYNGHPVINAYSQCTVKNCYMDNMNIERNIKINKWFATSKKPYTFTLFATGDIKAVVKYDPNPPKSTGNKGSGSSGHGSSTLPGGSVAGSETNSSAVEGNPQNGNEPFFFKKLAGIPVWAIIALCIILLFIIVVGIIVYKKLRGHKHVHKHRSKHHDEDDDMDDIDEEEDVDDVENNDQPQ